MKKFLTCVLVTLMVLSLSATAFAAEIDEGSTDPTGSTSVSYTVNPTYTVTIPASVTLGDTVTVSASDVVVPKGKQVVVKLTGTSETDSTFKLRTVEGAELTYTVKNDSTDVAIGATILAVNPTDTTNGSTTLTFVAPTSITYAGIYSGTVTFTVSVETVPSAPK